MRVPDRPISSRVNLMKKDDAACAEPVLIGALSATSGGKQCCHHCKTLCCQGSAP